MHELCTGGGVLGTMARSITPRWSPSATAGVLVGIGLAAGFLGGLLGAGTGVIFVPALAGIFGLSQRSAQATSIAVILPTAIAADLTYARHGHVDVHFAIPIAIGAVLCAAVSARLVVRVPTTLLQVGFFVLVVVSAAQLWWRA